jgi:hypothetical protein
MTKRELDRLFYVNVLPFIRRLETRQLTGKLLRDIPLRSQEYNLLMDSLHREGKLTDKQVATYSIPGRYL